MRSDCLAECRLGAKGYGGGDTYWVGNAHDWTEVPFRTGSANTSEVAYARKPVSPPGCDYVDDIGLNLVRRVTP